MNNSSPNPNANVINPAWADKVPEGNPLNNKKKDVADSGTEFSNEDGPGASGITNEATSRSLGVESAKKDNTDSSDLVDKNELLAKKRKSKPSKDEKKIKKAKLDKLLEQADSNNQPKKPKSKEWLDMFGKHFSGAIKDGMNGVAAGSPSQAGHNEGETSLSKATNQKWEPQNNGPLSNIAHYARTLHTPVEAHPDNHKKDLNPVNTSQQQQAEEKQERSLQSSKSKAKQESNAIKQQNTNTENQRKQREQKSEETKKNAISSIIENHYSKIEKKHSDEIRHRTDEKINELRASLENQQNNDPTIKNNLINNKEGMSGDIVNSALPQAIGNNSMTTRNIKDGVKPIATPHKTNRLANLPGH